MSHGYAEGRDALVKRLHRIEGQVRGIERMVEEDRYCIDILTQISAVTTALETAREAVPGGDWVQADLREYESARASSDLVLYVFVHLPVAERRAVLARAAAAVEPGGTLLVVGHDLLYLSEGWGGPSDPKVLFTPDDVAAELSGLTIERADRVRRPVTDEDGRPQVQVDAVVRATASA